MNMNFRDLRELIDTPWKITNEIRRWMVLPYVRFLFAFNKITWRKGWRFYGAPIIQKHRKSLIRIQEGIQLRSSAKSNPLGPNHPVIICAGKEGAVLEIGCNFAMTGGTLCAWKRICIGNRVTIGANSAIFDTNFHPLDPEYRPINPSDADMDEVVIEDDVFIGSSCIVLKGVTIGHGSVVGAGSVVRNDVPARVIISGNPAKILSRI